MKKPRRGRFNLRHGGACELKAARYRANLSQADVADRMGVHKNTVGGWERGIRPPTISQAFKLAKLYGTTVDDLFREYDAL